jgi:hypothetical protein
MPRLDRAQYSRDSEIHHNGRGVLDRSVEPGHDEQCVR